MKIPVAIVLSLLSCQLHSADVYEFKPKSKSEPVPEPVAVVEPPPVPAYEKTIVRQAKAAVLSELRVSPNSAEFREVRTFYGEGGIETVCGEFNPVDSGGQYIGFINFAFRNNQLAIEPPDLPLETSLQVALQSPTLININRYQALGCS